MAATVFEFGEFKLDSGRFELSRAGRSLRLERKPMELLILLAARKGELVSRAEIIERLWGSEVFVDTEHGINTAIRKIRQALRDDSDKPRFVQTVTAKGHRFMGPIVAVEAAPVKPSSSPSEIRSELPLVEQPSSKPPAGSKPASRIRRMWIWLRAATALVLSSRPSLSARIGLAHAGTLSPPSAPSLFSRSTTSPAIMVRITSPMV